MSNNPFTSHYDPSPVREWADSTSVVNLAQLFLNTVKNHGDSEFLGWKTGGQYRYMKYSDAHKRANWVASGLIELGAKTTDRVCLLSRNRPEWILADLGMQLSGIINVPLYPTLSSDAIEYAVNDSLSHILFIETHEHFDKLAKEQDKLPNLKYVITLYDNKKTLNNIKVYSWIDFIDLGKTNFTKNQEEIEQRTNNIKSTDVCSLVYTSGTTGNPKGAMLMHGNFASNCWGVQPLINFTPEDVELSFLPLCHVFERTLYYALTAAGSTICFAESRDTLLDDFSLAKPTFVALVPRVYEKIYEGVKAKSAGSPITNNILHWALKVGKKAYTMKRNNQELPFFLKLQHQLADRLVFGKIRAKTGGRVRCFASGGAPLRQDVGEFFLHAGMNLIEGYGLTETSPVITMNRIDTPRMGTVGQTIEQVYVKIAEDGEILSKGPNIMLGYFNKPEDTKSCISEDGWFATGDIGELSEDGFLRITDRKKEILVMSNGKNVAPQPLEQAMKKSRYIEQAVAIGDNKNFMSALIYPSWDQLEQWLQQHNKAETPRDELLDYQPLLDLLQKEVTNQLKEFSKHEQVRKIALLGEELTDQNGALTPTLKIKRRVINERYQELINKIYQE